MRKRTLISRSLLILGAGIVLARTARAAEPGPFFRGLGGNVGAAYEFGRLGDSDIGLEDRTMTAEAFETLLGYRTGPAWMFGAFFQYRFQQQQTSLRNAGGTNLANQGYLLGLGTEYRLDARWALQAALGFWGRYEFDRQTSTRLDDHLHGPLALRLEGKYFLARSWSVNAAVDLQRWRYFHVGGVDRTDPAAQWMIGLGLAYHFGFGDGRPSESTPETPAPPPPLVTPEPPDGTSAPVETTAIEPAPSEVASPPDAPTEGEVVARFASGSSRPDEDVTPALEALARELTRDPSLRITLEGYADNQGPDALNLRLSRARAAHVKRTLVARGAPAARIRVEGLGSANPVGDNSTESGRAQNRRVVSRKQGS